MKVLLRAVLGAVLVSFLVQPSPMLAQKTKPIELAAQFRDFDGDKIHSDGGGLYYTVRDPDRTYASVVELGADGRLKMQILKHRTVFFRFDANVRPVDLSSGRLTCHSYDGDVVFHVDPPSFLTGVPDNDSFYLWTFGKITYNGTEWVYDPSTMFDFRTMPVDANASSLVRVQINFTTVADVGGFGVMPNYQLWSAATPLAGGVVKVTHPTADSWVVEPQGADDPDAPLRSLGPNEAGFKITAPEVRRVHPGGNCDLGDWKMPFQITLYRR